MEQNKEKTYVLNTHLMLSEGEKGPWGLVLCKNILDEEIAETWDVAGEMNQIIFNTVLMIADLKTQIDKPKESGRAKNMIDTLKSFRDFLNKELESE